MGVRKLFSFGWDFIVDSLLELLMAAQKIWWRVGLRRPIISGRQIAGEQKKKRQKEQLGLQTARRELFGTQEESDTAKRISALKIEHPKGSDWMVGSGAANIQHILELFAANPDDCELTLTSEDSVDFVITRKKGILDITVVKKT